MRGHDTSSFYPDSDADGNSTATAAATASTVGTAAATATAAAATNIHVNSSTGDSNHHQDTDEDVVQGIARHLALCDDGIIILHVERFVILSNENNEKKEKKENNAFESSSDPFMSTSFAEGSRYATSSSNSANASTSAHNNASNTGSSSGNHSGNHSGSGSVNSVGTPIIRSEHYLLSYALFGIRTGRVQLSHPVTFLEVHRPYIQPLVIHISPYIHIIAGSCCCCCCKQSDTRPLYGRSSRWR